MPTNNGMGQEKLVLLPVWSYKDVLAQSPVAYKKKKS